MAESEFTVRMVPLTIGRPVATVRFTVAGKDVGTATEVLDVNCRRGMNPTILCMEVSHASPGKLAFTRSSQPDNSDVTSVAVDGLAVFRSTCHTSPVVPVPLFPKLQKIFRSGSITTFIEPGML